MKRICKPAWLKVNLSAGEHYSRTKQIVEAHGLHTICSSGRCPNAGECWRKGTATFMIGGEICTRSCKFCNTLTGRPLPLNPHEPERVAQSIELMGLKHAVITSVDRDDLPDFGAAHWADTILAIKEKTPHVTVEVLIPDFQGKHALIDKVIAAKPDVIAHNMETVKRITPLVRSAASYEVSLEVLTYIGQQGITTKSGIMVGLSESTDEVEELMDDLVAAGCKIFTIGQYLQPTRKHYPVMEYIHPDVFEYYKSTGLSKGFMHVESGPLVRSSYHAESQKI